MTEAVQMSLIQMAGPILVIVVTHMLSSAKLNHIAEVSNSMLTHTTAKKEEAEKRLEQVKVDELLVARTKIAELEKQVALMTTPVVVPVIQPIAPVPVPGVERKGE